MLLPFGRLVFAKRGVFCFCSLYTHASCMLLVVKDSDTAAFSVNNSSLWSLGAGIAITFAAAAYVTNIAKVCS